MSIEDLIKKCQENNIKAQKELYEMFAPTLMGICIKYCKDQALAEDLFQESFIKIFNKIHQFKGEGSFEGWLKRLSINTILTHLKKQIHFLPVSKDFVEDLTEETYDFEAYSIDFLLDKIQELPQQYRLVFNMYVLDDLPHREIADLLNIAVSTSKSNLTRAKALLRKEIKTKSS
ncbi:RNA polymerase sigma factor [Flavivirga eckloniae]|uniref:RNA polymerase subunit sigma-70 n=1 Tax=Flavivirga eckloniae TaxID=1803846 RepID=A0A2K9PNB4_9FLAO|nr:sigma-70 family RNA polymerase sigma factor [Flavivirga eckloniae]AUP78551.1 RNA polymerase subunit sigma-70 [Flavivirga eckloniae]